MYRPKFNKVLVEIDDADAQWGKSSEDNPLTNAYREGKLLSIGLLAKHSDYPMNDIERDETYAALHEMLGKQIMWHEGHEAGTVFEEGGKKYALIFWWDLIAAKED